MSSIKKILWHNFESFPTKHKVIFDDGNEKCMTTIGIMKWYQERNIEVPQPVKIVMKQEEEDRREERRIRDKTNQRTNND